MTGSHKLLLAFLVLAVALPAIAGAAPTSAPISLNPQVLPKGTESILVIMAAVTNWIFTILLVLAVIFLLLAAYNYLGGNEEHISKAHRMLLYTAVAVGVALLAFGFMTLVEQLVSAPQPAVAPQ